MAKARNISQDELKRLLNALRGPYALPVKVIIFIGILTGFRIQEILYIRLSYVLTIDGEIKQYLTVPARYMKRKKEARTVFLPEVLRAILKEYIDDYLTPRLQSRKDDYLFQRAIGDARALTYHRVWRSLKSAVERSGINPRGVTSHFMRKTWVRGFLDETEQENRYDTLQAAGQWKNRDSMMHYIPKDEERERIEETQIRLGELHQETAKEFFNIEKGA